jgi:cell division septation protein DedD
MDRALKERIIGAAVLVVFVVLVVPVFLDGPPESGDIVSERVPLPGQAADRCEDSAAGAGADGPKRATGPGTPART